MNRPVFKSACFLLLSFALGWGSGRLPEWRGAGVMDGGRRPEVKGPIGHGAGKGHHGGSTEAEDHKAGTGGKPGPNRLDILAAAFRSKKLNDGKAEEISLIAELAELSVQELAALSELLAEEEMDNGTRHLLLIRWAMLDPKAALAFVWDRPKFSGSTGLMAVLLGELGKIDLLEAKATLARLDYEQRNYAGRSLVRQLMLRDMRAALVCARELEFSDAEVDVLRNWAQSDPHAVAEELTSGLVRDLQIVELVAEKMIQENPQAFEAWAGRLADPVQRAVARRTALMANPAADSKATSRTVAAWLASGPEASEQAGDLPERVVQGLAMDGGQPSEVAAWATGLPPGLAQDKAIIEAGRLWMAQDVMEASSWLGSLPESLGKDGSVVYLVEKIAEETPEDAFEWARAIKTPSMRKAVLRQLSANWARKDPEAARQALETLPAEDLSSLPETNEARQ